MMFLSSKSMPSGRSLLGDRAPPPDPPGDPDERGMIFWARVLESVDREAIRRYWSGCLLQSEIDQVVGELRLVGRQRTRSRAEFLKDVGSRVVQRAGPYSFAKGRLDYVVPPAQSRVNSIDAALEYIRRHHRIGDPCIGICLPKKGFTVIGGWTENAILRNNRVPGRNGYTCLPVTPLPKGLEYAFV